MIPPREYRDIYDKTTWGPGLWQDEPDKRQWCDRATGLPCLIIRAPVTGGLCGYVGVPPEHPAYGLHYDGITAAEADAQRDAWRADTRAWAEAGYPSLRLWIQDHPLPAWPVPFPGIGVALAGIRVHGGLTYAGGSDPADRAEWRKFYRRIDKWRLEAQLFPRGDFARLLAHWGAGADDFAWWSRRVRASMICAVDEADAMVDLWWFGFDCGHLGDLSPRLEADLKEIGARHARAEIYRDAAYVERELESLTGQLADLTVTLMGALQ